MNLNFQSTTIGVIWSGIERFSVQIIQFVISIILARLLAPADFGLIAIVLVLMNILQTFNEVGFGAALMQKLDRDELDFSTVFVFNIIFGFALYGLIFFIAPFIAKFFVQPQLTSLTRLLGLNLIIGSAIVVQRTRLLIKIDFKTQAKASFIAVVLSGAVGVYCAYLDYGVMALVIQSLLANFINTILIWIFVGIKPKFVFSIIRFKRLFNFAYKLILARVINSVSQEMYSLIIGKIYSPAQLGFFNRAKSFEQLSSNNIVTIVQRVSVPVLCKVQNDNYQMGLVLMKFIRNTAFFVYPLLFGLFVLAEPLVIVLLTEKWLPVVWILRILIPVGFFFVISAFNLTVFNATGKTDLALKSEIIKKIIFVTILFVTAYFGFKALVFSQLIMAFIELVIDTYLTNKQIGLTFSNQIKTVSSIFYAAFSMAIIIMLLTLIIHDNYLKIALGVFFGLIVYFSICFVFNINNFRIYFQKFKRKKENV